MFTSVVGIILLSLASPAFTSQCKEGPLQDYVNFRRLAGTWVQAYYNGEFYGKASCLQHRIYGVNTEKKSFKMESKIGEIIPGEEPLMHTYLSTASWKRGGNGNSNVRDHFASDYQNYLIMYKCVEGKAIVDVELKEGKERLPIRKVREVSRILEDLGVDFFSLEPRQQLGCFTK